MITPNGFQSGLHARLHYLRRRGLDAMAAYLTCANVQPTLRRPRLTPTWTGRGSRACDWVPNPS